MKTALQMFSLILLAMCAGGCGPEPAEEQRKSTPTRSAASGELVPSPVRHEQLSEQQVAAITRLQNVFRDVDPSPLSVWLDNFSRDQSPGREIAIYESMAQAYTAFVQGRELSASAKQDVYRIVLLRSMTTPAEVLRRVELQTLGRDDARAVLALYDEPAAPVRVQRGKH